VGSSSFRVANACGLSFHEGQDQGSSSLPQDWYSSLSYRTKWFLTRNVPEFIRLCFATETEVCNILCSWWQTYWQINIVLQSIIAACGAYFLSEREKVLRKPISSFSSLHYDKVSDTKVSLRYICLVSKVSCQSRPFEDSYVHTNNIIYNYHTSKRVWNIEMKWDSKFDLQCQMILNTMCVCVCVFEVAHVYFVYDYWIEQVKYWFGSFQVQ